MNEPVRETRDVPEARMSERRTGGDAPQGKRGCDNFFNMAFSSFEIYRLEPPTSKPAAG
jgi:hypothetical protein